MSVATMGRQQQISTRPLTAVECRSWLLSYTEGRLGYLSGRGPRWVVVCNAPSPDDKIVLRVPESNEIRQYAPGDRVTLDVDGMTPLGYRHTVGVSGRTEVLPNPSVRALNGWSGESWPTSISTSIVASPVEEVHGTVQAERSTDARKGW